MSTDRPRLYFDVTKEQLNRLNLHMEYGMRKALFGLVVSQLLDLFDKHGADKIIGAMVTKAISLKDVIKLEVED